MTLITSRKSDFNSNFGKNSHDRQNLNMAAVLRFIVNSGKLQRMGGEEIADTMAFESKHRILLLTFSNLQPRKMT